MKSHRICVTGGSGFIGTTAMNWFLEKGFPVINFDIQPPKVFEHQQYWKYVDIRDSSAFTDSLIEFQPTHILHLAAMTGMDIHDISFFDANTKGVENLIRATSSLTDLQRVLFTSSLLVCRNGYVPSSDIDYCPPNLYGESKVIGEKLLRKSKMNCSWVIVRPTSIWGPWFEHSYRTFFKMLDRGFYFQPGKKPIVKPLSFVGNTVYMMQKLLLLENQQVNTHTFYLADLPKISIQEWADLIQKHLGKGKVPVLPITAMKFIAKVGDLLKNLGYLEPPLTTFRLKNMLTGADYPIEKTHRLIGSLPFTWENGVVKTLFWMQQQKLIHQETIIK